MDTDIVLQSFVDHYDAVRPIVWSDLFCSQGPLDLEIGCGNGEFLARQAQEVHGRNFVGIEQSWERVYKTLRKVAQAELKNVRVLQVDVRVALERLFLPESIDNIYCLFPCPWPKKAHIKHRLFSTDFLRLTNSRLKPGGLLKIVTDFEPYYDWILEQTAQTGFAVKTDTVTPSYDTKYERKWMEQGQKVFFEIDFTKKRNIDVAVPEDKVLKSYSLKHFDPNRFTFEEHHGPETIVLKEFLYDDKKKTAIMRLLVVEGALTQNIWVAVVANKGRWLIVPAQGNRLIPSEGIALAMDLVYQACKTSTAQT